MFSGGFDSLLIALLAQRYGARVTAVTVRFDDFNPFTVAEATLLAHKMGIQHHIIHVTLSEFLLAFGSLAVLIDNPLLDLDLVVVYAALKKYDPRMGGKTFISGMGSDQWFGDEALKGKSKDLKIRLDQAAVDTDVHHKVAKAHGYKFIFPFLSMPMLTLSQQIPIDLKKNKKLLREFVDRANQELLFDRGTKREIQVPAQVRHLLMKVYDHRSKSLVGEKKR